MIVLIRNHLSRTQEDSLILNNYIGQLIGFATPWNTIFHESGLDFYWSYQEECPQITYNVKITLPL